MGWQDALSKYPLGSIKEVHLSDNNGKEDSHMPLGDGSIDFEKLFDEIVKRREEPIFTIESHSKECLEKSLNFIRRFIDE
jgi:sugar phosphate isomerase/epimerase